MTTATRPAWLAKLHPDDIYEGLPEAESDLQGWGADHGIFEQLIQEVRPSLIVEVGSWKGASAVHMARILKAHDIDCIILAVDTWLGSLEQLMSPNAHGFSRFRVNGHPIGLYAQFMANVKNTGFQDIIVPLPSTSTAAARWLAKNGVKADLVYIDGSHEEEEVFLDLLLFGRILSPTGTMFGDDIQSRPEVRRAVKRYAESMGQAVAEDGNKWKLKQ